MTLTAVPALAAFYLLARAFHRASPERRRLLVAISVPLVAVADVLAATLLVASTGPSWHKRFAGLWIASSAVVLMVLLWLRYGSPQDRVG